MSQPTSISVGVDRSQYSRYEPGRDVINTSVAISGGATYTDEEIFVELVKARRSRDAVVGVVMLTFNGSTDPQTSTVGFNINDLVDQDLLNLVRHGRYFMRARSLATTASVVIGTGTSTPITINTVETGTVTNTFTVEVVVPSGTGALGISVVAGVVTINLAVSGGVPIASQNKREDIVAYIAQHLVTDLTAFYTGSPGLSLTVAEGPTSFAGGRDEVLGESSDFDVRIVTVERLKRDYIFGIPLIAGSVHQVRFQPSNITGVSVEETSRMHSLGVFPLTYNYIVDGLTNATASIGSGSNGTVNISAVVALEGSAGNAWNVVVVVPSGNAALSVTASSPVLTVNLAVSGGVPITGQNTATLVAAAIDALPNFAATASGTGGSSLSLAEGPTDFTGGTDRTSRMLSWGGGPLVSVNSAGSYILRRGGSTIGGIGSSMIMSAFAPDYIIVNVMGPAFLPTVAAVDELLVDNLKIDDEALNNFLKEAEDWVENVALAIYLEPTNVVTDRDPTSIQFAAGINSPNPIFTDPDFDFIKSPLTYFVPRSGSEWVDIETPYPQLLRVDSLFGSIANTRVIDIDLDWIQLSQQSGLIQLVPFNQTIAFDFLGLIWVNAIRGAAAIPNFWHYNMIAGLRDCPNDLQDLIAKKAAMDALMILGAALRPGIGSTSLGRDGVSQSISYATQSKYGPYTGIIQGFSDWIEKNLRKFVGAYRGPTLRVV